MPSNKLHNQLSEKIFTISRLMKENFVCESPASNLTLLQLHTLIFIAKKGNAHMREIAAHFHVEMPTATSLINKLCNMKLAERISDPTDRRIVNITLTNEGKNLLRRAKTQHEEKINNILGYLSIAEKEEFLGILEKLISKMKLVYEK